MIILMERTMRLWWCLKLFSNVRRVETENGIMSIISHKNLLAAETNSRTGEVFIWKKRVQRNLFIRQLSTEAFTQGLQRYKNITLRLKQDANWKKQYIQMISFASVCHHCAAHLQSPKHDPGLARGAGVSVLHLLSHSLQQKAVVCGRRDGLSADVLHRTEGIRRQTQVVETLLEQRVCVTRHFGVCSREEQILNNHSKIFKRVWSLSKKLQ